MIRKISHIILSFVLLLTTTGLAITENYCGDRLVSVNVLSEPDKCCDNSDCCHNETIIIKLDTDIINISPDKLSELIYLPASLIPIKVYNDNSLLSKYLTSNSFRYSDLPPPGINSFLSNLGTFLL
ncbi:MAG: hypothetical protein JSV22_11655 [Bacteroidales bacterium]|nr:MAG: hypothetical protein JSV22_11655 [Bacteroidales bacterium]